MTYLELYRRAEKIIERAGCGSPAFDAGCLLGDITGIERGMLPIKGGETAPAALCEKMLDAARQRAAGKPLQYILGRWDFLSLTLEVGEGVLIPRPDTEVLCQTAAGLLKGKRSPKVVDLCAGSGCVGLGVASLLPDVEVTAVELSERAMDYLVRNCARYPMFKVNPVQADVLKPDDRFDREYDAVLANPPYIPTEELPSLMREVKHEPEMALDGGDGLIFYRAIAKIWIPKLVEGGICAVEVGIGQAEEVAVLFRDAGLRDIQKIRDLGGIERVVAGIRQT